jgi:hypothetical protein
MPQRPERCPRTPPTQPATLYPKLGHPSTHTCAGVHANCGSYPHYGRSLGTGFPAVDACRGPICSARRGSPLLAHGPTGPSGAFRNMAAGRVPVVSACRTFRASSTAYQRALISVTNEQNSRAGPAGMRRTQAVWTLRTAARSCHVTGARSAGRAPKGRSWPTYRTQIVTMAPSGPRTGPPVTQGRHASASAAPSGPDTRPLA